MRRLSTRVFSPALAVHVSAESETLGRKSLERQNGLGTSAKRSFLNAAAMRWTT